MRKERQSYIQDARQLINAIQREFKIANDTLMAEFLDLDVPFISKIRNLKQPINSRIILKAYDATGWPIERIRSYIKPIEERKAA